ncbi:MAG: hypothetical protein KDE15_12500 [Erythrobacter sp.]|nr:hypothetical protein [Erythrobacter sp.]
MTQPDQPETPAPEAIDAPLAAPLDQSEMPLDMLAQAVLDRKLRPRALAVRRLAEGVLALQADLKKARKKGKKSGKKKDRKLATIPGQKKRK